MTDFGGFSRIDRMQIQQNIDIVISTEGMRLASALAILPVAKI
jgi:hypothetical protein